MDKKEILHLINKSIILSMYIFALGIFTSKFLIYLGMGLSLIFWLLKLALIRSNYIFKKGGFLIPVLLFSSSIFISGIGNWSNEILGSKFFYSFIFFFIVINEINDFKVIKKIIKILLFSATIAALYGLYQSYFLKMDRVIGFTSSLAFGNFMAVLVIFLTVFLIWGNLTRNQIIFMTIMDILFFLNLIFTKTRGAWLGFLAAVFILGLIKGKKILLISIVILLVVFMMLPNIYTDRFISSFNTEYNLETNRSNSTRIALWTSALKMFLDNPVNGVGYDQFKSSYKRDYKIENIPPFSHSHNNILNIAAELGLIGLLTFIYLMIFILKKLILYYQKETNQNLKLFYMSSILTFVVYHVQGLTQYNFGDTEPLHFFWFYIAIIYLINCLKSNNCIYNKKGIE